MDDEEQLRARIEHEEHLKHLEWVETQTDSLTEDEARWWVEYGPDWSLVDAVCLISYRRSPRWGCSVTEEREFVRSIWTSGVVITDSEVVLRFPAKDWISWWGRSGHEVPAILSEAFEDKSAGRVSRDKALHYLAALMKMLKDKHNLTAAVLAADLGEWRKTKFRAGPSDRVGFSPRSFQTVAAAANTAFDKSFKDHLNY